MSTLVDPQYNWRIKEWFPELSSEVHTQLQNYFNFILQNNKSANIVASKTLANADLVHFADSICAAKVVREKLNKSIDLFDIGSGAGFPGMVYAILYSDQKVNLVESDERKARFLALAAQQLNLKNVSVFGRKIETFPPDTITQAITRDFMPMPRLLMTLRKIVTKGGVVFHLKSDEWSLEVSEIPSQLCSSWLPGLESKYQLPLSDSRLYVVRTDKI